MKGSIVADIRRTIKVATRILVELVVDSEVDAAAEKVAFLHREVKDLRKRNEDAAKLQKSLFALREKRDAKGDNEPCVPFPP